MVEVIEWIMNYLKTPYGVPSLLRFSKETEQPPAASSSGFNSRREVVNEGENLRVTVDLGSEIYAEPVASEGPVASSEGPVASEGPVVADADL